MLSQGYTPENVFSDNDALASIVAAQLNAEVLLLLTDVEGLYDRPPSEPGATVIDTFSKDTQVGVGQTAFEKKKPPLSRALKACFEEPCCACVFEVACPTRQDMHLDTLGLDESKHLKTPGLGLLCVAGVFRPRLATSRPGAAAGWVPRWRAPAPRSSAGSRPC